MGDLFVPFFSYFFEDLLADIVNINEWTSY
jgi:hypothetical protein